MARLAEQVARPLEVIVVDDQSTECHGAFVPRAPFIARQRHNRARLLRVLARVRRRVRAG